ncbi:MAG TPA: DUF5317 family protein [Acidimicrobiales bacterium]|nr:DUF5317 family protein [Acidimicrobiales bacterium]
MVLDALVLSFLAILGGLFVGLMRHGRLRNLTLLRVRWWPALALGVAVPALVDRFDPPAAVPLVVIGLVALLAFAVGNVHIVGMSVVAIGVLANLAPVVANNGMPVRAEALVDAGLAARDELDRVHIHGAQRLERAGDHITWLGDVLPVRETRQVLSFGDLLILAGVADVAANLTLRRVRVRGRLPKNAEAALVAIAPPPERVDAAPAIDIRQFETAMANGYAERPEPRFIDLRSPDPAIPPVGEWPPVHLRRQREPREPRIPRGLTPEEEALDPASLARTGE